MSCSVCENDVLDVCADRSRGQCVAAKQEKWARVIFRGCLRNR